MEWKLLKDEQPDGDDEYWVCDSKKVVYKAEWNDMRGEEGEFGWYTDGGYGEREWQTPENDEPITHFMRITYPKPPKTI